MDVTAFLDTPAHYSLPRCMRSISLRLYTVKVSSGRGSDSIVVVVLVVTVVIRPPAGSSSNIIGSSCCCSCIYVYIYIYTTVQF